MKNETKEQIVGILHQTARNIEESESNDAKDIFDKVVNGIEEVIDVLAKAVKDSVQDVRTIKNIAKGFLKRLRKLPSRILDAFWGQSD